MPPYAVQDLHDLWWLRPAGADHCAAHTAGVSCAGCAERLVACISLHPAAVCVHPGHFPSCRSHPRTHASSPTSRSWMGEQRVLLVALLASAGQQLLLAVAGHKWMAFLGISLGSLGAFTCLGSKELLCALLLCCGLR